jgi:hypothetical protein
MAPVLPLLLRHLDKPEHDSESAWSAQATPPALQAVQTRLSSMVHVCYTRTHMQPTVSGRAGRPSKTSKQISSTTYAGLASCRLVPVHTNSTASPKHEHAASSLSSASYRCYISTIGPKHMASGRLW